VLSKGAWISQQQVRDHTSPCGGNDNEILSCNIDEAWTNLKLDYDGFDFEGQEVRGGKGWSEAAAEARCHLSLSHS